MNASSRVIGLLLFCALPSAIGVVFHAGFQPITMGTISGSSRFGVDGDLGGNCTDYKRQPVGPGDRFVPLGYDACTTCTCEQSRPEMCLSMLCSPPKECANLVPLDDKCCEFECFDMGGGVGHSGGGLSPSNITVPGASDVTALNATNLGLRLVASTITSFLILALLLFMIHRLRQRRMLLMIRRINASQVVGIPYGDHRYAMGEDGPVGYFTGHDHVDFGPYDDPPPPYTFWKPPNCFFSREEAPPPYDVSQQVSTDTINGNHQQRNHCGVENYHSVQVSYPLPYSHPVNYMPHQQQSHYANLPLHHGIIPSLTQVSLRTNNFQMNDLDQETGDTCRRHSVPVQELNVVGSRTSLNASQNELNMESPTEAIRSDDMYDHHVRGSLPPLSANGVAPLSSTDHPVLRSKWEEEANLEMQCPTSSLCSDNNRGSRLISARDSSKSSAEGKHCGLHSHASNLNFCPDPTMWEADASETSSSSSPTFERATMSSTSSDSSSIDYAYGQHNHSQRTIVPFTGRKSSLPCVMTAAQVSSLDCTLDSIRSKLYMKGPGKLRRLLGGRNSAGDISTRRITSQDVQLGHEEAVSSSLPQATLPCAQQVPCAVHLSSENQSTARSSQQRSRSRPRSYDFADLCSNRQTISCDLAGVASTYPIVEETSTSTDGTHCDNTMPVSENPEKPHVDYYCGNSYATDHCSSSLDSCTCSLSSIARTPSHERPASIVSCPMHDKDGHHRHDENNMKGVTCATLSRSCSICSETGEPRQHSVDCNLAQFGAINVPVSISLANEGQDLEKVEEDESNNAGVEECTSPSLPMPAAHNCVRVALGCKGSHESYI